MPYIGHEPTNAGNFYILDDFNGLGQDGSSSTYDQNANGTIVNFKLMVAGVAITPNVDNLIVTIDGVLQHPTDAYSISGSILTFTGAPASGVDFHVVIMGQSATVGEGSIGADELEVSGDGTDGQLLKTDGDGTFSWINQNTVTASTANVATHVTVADNESTNENNLIPFVEDASGAGNVGLESDGDLHYNPSTGRLTATQLAGTLQTAAQTNITSVGTIGTGVWNGTAIASAYLDADTAHLSGTQTFSGAKTFTSGQIYLDSSTDADLKLSSGGTGDSQIGFWDGSTNKAYFVWDRSDDRMELNTALDFEVQTNLIVSASTPVLYVNSSTAGKAVMKYQSGGATKGGVGLAGRFLGTSVTDMMIYAESGDGINFYTNGNSSNPPLVLGSDYNATFAGNVYINGSASSANYNLGIENTDTFAEFFSTSHSGSNKGYKFYHSNTGGSLILTLDTSKNATFAGNVGIGTTPASGVALHIDDGASTELRLEGTTESYINFDDGSDPNVGQIYYNVSSGFMSFKSNNVERMRILSSGGITFNGDTAAANALDDYEEGTWTAGFEGASVSSVDNTTGYYTKIGRMVYFSYYAGSLTIASASGAAVITGLPFTSSNSTQAYGQFTTTHGTHIDGSSPGGYVNKNETKMTFVDLNATSAATYINGSLKYLMVSGFYHV